MNNIATTDKAVFDLLAPMPGLASGVGSMPQGQDGGVPGASFGDLFEILNAALESTELLETPSKNEAQATTLPQNSAVDLQAAGDSRLKFAQAAAIIPFSLGSLLGVGGSVQGQSSQSSVATDDANPLDINASHAKGTHTLSITTNNAASAIPWPLVSTGITTNPSGILSKIPNGRFRVLAAEVNQGQLNLVVSPLTAPEQTLKLSVPVDVLNSMQASGGPVDGGNMPDKAGAASRVPVQDMSAGRGVFEQFIDGLKISELEIRSFTLEKQNSNSVSTPRTYASANGNTNSVVEIVGLSEQPQAKVLFQAQLGPQQIQAIRPVVKASGTKVPRVAGDQDAEGLQQAAISDDAPIDQNNQLVQRAVSARFVKDKPGSFDPDSLIPKQQADQLDANNSLMSASDKHVGKSTMVEAKLEPPAVRFTLPDNLSQYLKADGKSLTIRIEPEHLGPARLTLTMQDDHLTARLTVDNAQAKSTIEQSLDQLSRQLDRAGIKVDHIEVSLRGGGAGLPFSHRQTDWFGTRRNRVVRDWTEPVSGSIATAAGQLVNPLSYVSPTAVNIYA